MLGTDVLIVVIRYILYDILYIIYDIARWARCGVLGIEWPNHRRKAANLFLLDPASSDKGTKLLRNSSNVGTILGSLFHYEIFLQRAFSSSVIFQVKKLRCTVLAVM